MPDLIAQGRRPQDRWRRALPDQPVESILGRTSQPWAVRWDDRISRQHATLVWNGTRLQVTRLPDSRNAIFFQGRQCDQFEVDIGEHFVIGQTTFTLIDQQVNFSQVLSPAVAEQTFSAQALRQNKYKDAGRRIEALGKLPEIIAGASDDSELCSRVVNLLLEGVPQASFVAIVRLITAGAASDDQQTNSGKVSKQLDTRLALEVLHWDCRSLAGREFSPSVSLVKAAERSGQSVLHVWNRSISDANDFTQSENVDWAFCTPVLSDSCPGWAIYVAGDFPSAGLLSIEMPAADQLQDDLKFTELAATTLGALRQVRMLQRRQDSLSNFFAPVVLSALSGRDPDQVLAPRQTNVSVLFCDLQGFSKHSEAADELLELLQRVSGALGVMTHHILAGGGVVGDFHGDAAMGFWGWPLADSSYIQKTCQAAVEIRREFLRSAAEPDHPLANFLAGLGIATGPAVAGRIGTADQVKVTVFGPVVNLASRLESMTRQLRASILIDEATAQWVRSHASSTELRVRRVARILPYGMTTPLVVSELLPPAGPDCILTDEHLLRYERALDCFLRGQWQDAFRLLHEVPAEDQVKDFITFQIAQHHRTAPVNWDGIIRLPSK
ncbi:MAG: adenylate/guanylate cyclase domain-containing protein [Pirellulaceae bacterium]|nr:adenylate/guanylate cyclase domain-containing protein [Pirellulaceae bacterium]